MYQGAETKEMRDARLEKAVLERDGAVKLLWSLVSTEHNLFHSRLVGKCDQCKIRKFLESLT